MKTVPNNLLISFQFFKCETGQIIESFIRNDSKDKYPHCKCIYAVSGKDLYN